MNETLELMRKFAEKTVSNLRKEGWRDGTETIDFVMSDCGGCAISGSCKNGLEYFAMRKAEEERKTWSIQSRYSVVGGLVQEI